ncbi:glycosyltransferase family 2 protein [Flavobacterium sp. LC2016-01]|uniref:glycosyltransferase family 2 protein n=1 Tax=Flavobacterium sp. LC2016-01 TaxID=2675876 RepID=UPI0012BAD257|nr:glycosyltransferase family 2 protein [Flavobacterium sp. LC2016-01]MTH17535.1 glycosyltransferase [Flavobacterium sp. LC2016-01]
MNPLISIIIPNYNHAAFLTQRLDSVFNQTYQNFEVILLDDKSTDNSIVILEKYANHPKVSHFIVNRENSGSPFKQWQRGIQLAKGKYIWIAESDDYCELTFLSKLIKCTDDDSLIGVIYCQTNDVNKNGDHLANRINYTSRFRPNIWEKDFVKDGQEFVESYLSFINVIPNASAVIFKKELVEDAIFSTPLIDMKMCGDWYFWVRIILKSKVCFVSETLNYFREHQSVSRNHNDMFKKKLRLLEEKSIRIFMNSVQIINLQSEELLYSKWFNLHGYRAIFTRPFYAIKLENISFFLFLKMCIQSKFSFSNIKSKFKFVV